MSWSTFFDVGGVAGALSLIWQGVSAFRSRGKRPRLRFLPFTPVRDLRSWQNTQHQILGKLVTLEVVNRGDRLAVRSVARATILESPQGVSLPHESFALHWAPVPYSMTDSGEEPVDIGSSPVRLDVIVAKPASPGCFFAVPLALGLEQGAPQVHLPPGRYRIQVVVTSAEGDPGRIELVVTSPSSWQDLDATQLS